MGSTSPRAASPWIGLALAAGCGGLADGDYQGQPLAVIQGTLTQAGPMEIAGETSFALVWAPASDHDAALNLLGTAAPLPDGGYSETCNDLDPASGPLCDGTAAKGDRRCDWTDRRLGSLVRVVDYQAHLPAGFEIAIRELPPEAARYDLSRQGGFGSFAVASLVAFDDMNRDGALRLGNAGSPPEPTLADSGRQTHLPGPNQPRRSYFLAYLDGLIDHRSIDPALAEILLFLPQGFSLWVEEEWLDGYGRTTASGRFWRPFDDPIELFMPTRAVAGCEAGTRQTVYLPAIPEGEVPTWCSNDRFRATWSRTSTSGCVTVEERYSRDFSCTGSLPPAWACQAPTTGSLVVSVTTTGEDLDPNGYELRIDGGAPQGIGSNASLALPAVSPGSHTVAIEGLASLCAVAGASTIQVTVAAGETAYVAFPVECWRPGSVQLFVDTQGHSVDPDGFLVGVDGSAPRATPINSVATYSGLRPGIHVVSLSGLASNCSVVAGENPLQVDVLPEVTVIAVFHVQCALLVGDVRVTTATSGLDQDQDGYAVTLFNELDWGGGSYATQPIAANGSVLFQDVRLGLHYEPPFTGISTVSISGLARNCAVSGPSAYAVPAAYGQAVDLPFAIQCAAAGTITLTTTTSGADLDPDGYSLTWSGAGQSETVALPANGTTAVAGLLPGQYQLTLGGLAPNCDGPRTATATVVAGAATPVAVDFTCTPDRGLAIVSYVDGNTDIYLIRSSGTGMQRLTVHPATDLQPAWSPDGARLAFASDQDGNYEIYVMDADGSNQTRLTAEPAADYSPDWSPDGTRIAFVSERDGNLEIYVMEADGSSPRRLTADPAVDFAPAWSPDGSQIAFERWNPRGSLIHVMNADGSGTRALPAAIYDSGYDRAPAWSPDGTRIAFVTAWTCFWECNGWLGLGVRNADGTGLSWLVADGSGSCIEFGNPAWSPDGRHLAFTVTWYDCFGGTDWSETRIQIVRADGTELADLASGFYPAWRP